MTDTNNLIPQSNLPKYKNEKEFVDDIVNNITSLAKELKLSPIKKVFKEKELTRDLFELDGRMPIQYKNKDIFIPRVDILIQHENVQEATVIEVKLYKELIDLTTGLGKLLFYQEFLKLADPKLTKIRSILIADNIPVNDVLATVAKNNRLNIEFVEWKDNKISVLESVDTTKNTNQKVKEGRPLLWTDPQVLEKLIDNYFDTEKEVTLSGLAQALGISRKTLYNYEEKDEFLYMIKKAREKVETCYEKKIIYGSQPTGTIFALKNMGWADKLETDVTTKGKELPAPILNGVTNVHPNNSDEQDPEVK